MTGPRQDLSEGSERHRGACIVPISGSGTTGAGDGFQRVAVAAGCETGHSVLVAPTTVSRQRATPGLRSGDFAPCGGACYPYRWAGGRWRGLSGQLGGGDDPGRTAAIAAAGPGVRHLDLAAFYTPIAARGSDPGTAGWPATDPRLLAALWLYATVDGVGDGRRFRRRSTRRRSAALGCGRLRCGGCGKCAAWCYGWRWRTTCCTLPRSC